MELKQIKDLMAYLEGSKLRKLVFKKGDMELHLEKESHSHSPPSPPPHESKPVHHQAHPHHELPSQPERTSRSQPEQADGKYVSSPMVGTFYTAPAPDQPLFVKVGDKVEADTIVCIIEAMKVMNEVKAGVSGTVGEIIAENAQPVEYGTRLLRIV